MLHVSYLLTGISFCSVLFTAVESTPHYTPVYANYLTDVKLLSSLKPNEQGTWLKGAKRLATIASGSLIIHDDKYLFRLDKDFNLILPKLADDNNGLLNFTCKTTSGEHKYSVSITVYVKLKYLTYNRTSSALTLEIDPRHLVHRVDEISSWLILNGERCEDHKDPYKLKNVLHRSLDNNCEKGLCLVQFPFNVSERVDKQQCIQISFKNINQKEECFGLPQRNITADSQPQVISPTGTSFGGKDVTSTDSQTLVISPTGTSFDGKDITSTEGTPTPQDSGANTFKIWPCIIIVLCIHVLQGEQLFD